MWNRACHSEEGKVEEGKEEEGKVEEGMVFVAVQVVLSSIFPFLSIKQCRCIPGTPKPQQLHAKIHLQANTERSVNLFLRK